MQSRVIIPINFKLPQGPVSTATQENFGNGVTGENQKINKAVHLPLIKWRILTTFNAQRATVSSTKETQTVSETKERQTVSDTKESPPVIVYQIYNIGLEPPTPE